jgi:hypothetical protein
MGGGLTVGVWTEAWDAVGFGEGGWVPEPIWPTKSISGPTIGSFFDKLRKSQYIEWFHMDGRELLFAAYYSRSMVGWAVGRSSLVVFYDVDKGVDTRVRRWYLKESDAVIYIASISAESSDEGIKWKASHVIPSENGLVEIGPAKLASYKVLDGYLVELRIPYKDLRIR